MIFVFNGPPSSGKDEGALFFKTSYNFKPRSFKYELFLKTMEYFSVSEEWFMKKYTEKEKEIPEDLLGGRSRRAALIHVAEDIVKPNHGLDYFGNQAASNITLPGNYCFSDSGFKEELQPLINKFGVENVIIIQLLRDGCDYSKDSRNYLTGQIVEEYILKKETKIDTGKEQLLPVRTYRIHNNGTLKMFRETLEKIYKKECDGSKDPETKDFS